MTTPTITPTAIDAFVFIESIRITDRKAAEAGARGVSAAPMSRQRRIDAYQAQNVLAGDRRMSERQFRQLQRMNIRAAFATA